MGTKLARRRCIDWPAYARLEPDCFRPARFGARADKPVCSYVWIWGAQTMEEMRPRPIQSSVAAHDGKPASRGRITDN